MRRVGPRRRLFNFGRSPLEWIINRYHVKTDKASGDRKRPERLLRERGRSDAVVDLIKRLVTVSMRTQELVASLSPSWRSQPRPNITKLQKIQPASGMRADQVLDCTLGIISR